MKALALSRHFLNSYEISDPSMLAWPVSLYEARRIDKKPQTHEDRGSIKNLIWTLRKQYASRCPGLGFVIDLDERTVAVPATWNLPVPISFESYEITLVRSLTTDWSEPNHIRIIAGIIRDGVKNHFKNNHSDDLGYLWQDYNDFCQIPEHSVGEEFVFCRRFGVAAKILRGKKWVIRFLIGTASLDGKSLNDYYLEGEVEKLAAMIDAKKINRFTRSGRPTAVRVWCNESTQYQIKARVLELDEPSVIVDHKILSRREQRSLANGTVRCRVFNGTPIDLPLNQIRLILDTQITQEEHGDTIIEPQERQNLVQRLRNFVSGANIYGHGLYLAETPLNIDDLPTIFVTPPAIRLKGENGAEKLIEAPVDVSHFALAKRCRQRSDYIRQFGFLQQRPINPLLALPQWMGEKRARRMRSDLEYIWSLQGIDFRFGFFMYSNVEDIRKEVEHHQYDALLALIRQ
jgi:hypothetical protein